MWKNAIVATVTMLFGIVLFLFGALDFLAPYKTILLHQYSVPIGVYAGLLAVNLYAAFFLLTRKLFLKDTGAKLVHLEK
jgi:drug/metabolite transporter (DMT)-like permease